MSAAVYMKGLWVPQQEARRYAKVKEVEGLLNLDVRKARAALDYCVERNVALDIGAHIGATSVFLSRHFQRVEAFEAIPETFEFLVRNTDHIENVVARNIAAADREGELNFEYLEKHTQLAHVMAGDSQYYQQEGSRVIGPIIAKALDSLGLGDVSFIKIDVEGTELDVLRGLERTILTSKPVIMIEQNQNESRYHGRQAGEATQFLVHLGMRQIRKFPFKQDRLFTFR